jgi:hypothetical protein
MRQVQYLPGGDIYEMTLVDSVVALWMKGQRRWGGRVANQRGAQVHSATKANNHPNGQP